jgi:hypothetical protein
LVDGQCEPIPTEEVTTLDEFQPEETGDGDGGDGDGDGDKVD